jgi:DNA invertase Pin-like site-specific DNA recombinase
VLLDVLAAVARKDYDDRRRRQAQGIAKVKAEGKNRACGKASKFLQEAARIMKRTPERIRQVAMRRVVSFKSESKKKR